MMDEIFDRGYQTGRTELHNGIGRLIGRIRDAVEPAMDAFHRVEWAAPWDNQPTRKA